MSFDDAAQPEAIIPEVSDPSHLATLRRWLQEAGAEVAAKAGAAGPGELGATDALTVLAGSSGLVAAIKVLPDFIRARRSNFRIEATVRDRSLTLEATNIDEVMPLLERLLDE